MTIRTIYIPRARGGGQCGEELHPRAGFGRAWRYGARPRAEVKVANGGNSTSNRAIGGNFFLFESPTSGLHCVKFSAQSDNGNVVARALFCFWGLDRAACVHNACVRTRAHGARHGGRKRR